MKRLAWIFATLFLVACSAADDSDSTQGVADSGTRSAWHRGAMAAAADSRAVAAAIEILEKGGSAVDAAIATHAVLGLVEPQSSGLGGGAFMLVYERQNKELTYFDGRETAPAGATVDMFMRDGEVLEFFQSWQSGLAIGVPGTLALYKSAHDRHGKLPWADLFQPAIRLAQSGFEVSPRLANYLPMMAERGRLDEDPGSAAYFYPEGKALQVGDLRTNPEYANTLTRVATEGIEAFYSGEIAEAMANAAREGPDGGSMVVEDIARYRAVSREVICGGFREMNICTTSPPSSGAAQIMIAGLYDHLASGAENQADKIAAFVDAQRLAYADRDYYFGDPDAIDVPLHDLINPQYIKHRATERIAPDAVPTHGDPGTVLHQDSAAYLWAPDTTAEVAGTTHFSIIDNEGNAVAMSATVGGPFGASRWVAGFLLNNELTDFALDVRPDGKPVANAIGPGKRPRSSLSPTIVLDGNGELLMVTGSVGGNSIPAYVAKTIIGVFDWDLSAQEAVNFPNIVARGESVRVEISVEPGQAIAGDLAERGYDVQERQGENAASHVIVVRPNELEGAADPRREGIVSAITAQ
jgi:gamma-glutamyltranspeptidase/glutathione hydrolase